MSLTVAAFSSVSPLGHILSTRQLASSRGAARRAPLGTAEIGERDGCGTEEGTVKASSNVGTAGVSSSVGTVIGDDSSTGTATGSVMFMA